MTAAYCECKMADPSLGRCSYPYCPQGQKEQSVERKVYQKETLEKHNPIEQQIKNLNYRFQGPVSIDDLYQFFRIVSVDVPLFPELEKNTDENARFERAMNEWLPIVLKARE
jgi:glycerol-3-phosphate dehydrogenase